MTIEELREDHNRFLAAQDALQRRRSEISLAGMLAAAKLLCYVGGSICTSVGMGYLVGRGWGWMIASASMWLPLIFDGEKKPNV